MANDERDCERSTPEGSLRSFASAASPEHGRVGPVRRLSGAQLLALTADDLADEELGLEPNGAAKLARLIREETSRTEPGGGPVARNARAWRARLLAGAAAAIVAASLAVLVRRRRRR